MFVGAWPSQPDDGNLINSSDLSWSRDVFAIGDELGYIRLFRFPCSQPGVSKPTLGIPLGVDASDIMITEGFIQS